MHGPVHAEHVHDHTDYAGDTHSHAHVHRGDKTHRPGAGHRHGPPGGPLAAAPDLPGLDELDAEAVYEDLFDDELRTAAAADDDEAYEDEDLFAAGQRAANTNAGAWLDADEREAYRDLFGDEP